MAMDILPIQGTSVPCEHIFSSGKETATARRNWIAADLMEALQMMKYAFKHSHSLNFMGGMSKDEETAALEAKMAAEDDVPEDVAAFIELLCSEK